jgi:hypothetical protein
MKTDEELQVKFGTGEYSNYIEIGITGMGTANVTGGPIMYLEKEDGKWVLRVWADINQEDATHRIDLSNAFESNLKED